MLWFESNQCINRYSSYFKRVLPLKMRQVVVGMEGLKVLHIGCCLFLAAYFFFSESNVETTRNVGELCSGSIAGFDDDPELLLMFRYENGFLTFVCILLILWSRRLESKRQQLRT